MSYHPRVNYTNGTPVPLPTSPTPQNNLGFHEVRMHGQSPVNRKNDLQRARLLEKLLGQPASLVDELFENPYQIHNRVGPAAAFTPDSYDQYDSLLNPPSSVSPGSIIRTIQQETIGRPPLPKATRQLPSIPQNSNSYGMRSDTPLQAAPSWHTGPLSASSIRQGQQGLGRPTPDQQPDVRGPDPPFLYKSSTIPADNQFSGANHSLLHTDQPTRYPKASPIVPPTHAQASSMAMPTPPSKRQRMSMTPASVERRTPFVPDNRSSPALQPQVERFNASPTDTTNIASLPMLQQQNSQMHTATRAQMCQHQAPPFRHLHPAIQQRLLEGEKLKAMFHAGQFSNTPTVQQRSQNPAYSNLTEASLAQLEFLQQRQHQEQQQHHRHSVSPAPPQHVFEYLMPPPQARPGINRRTSVQQQHSVAGPNGQHYATRERPVQPQSTPTPSPAQRALAQDVDSAYQQQQWEGAGEFQRYTSGVQQANRPGSIAGQNVLNQMHVTRRTASIHMDQARRPPSAPSATIPAPATVRQTGEYFDQPAEQQYHKAGQYINNINKLINFRTTVSSASSTRKKMSPSTPFFRPQPVRPAAVPILESNIDSFEGPNGRKVKSRGSRLRVSRSQPPALIDDLTYNAKRFTDSIPGTSRKRNVSEIYDHQQPCIIPAVIEVSDDVSPLSGRTTLVNELEPTPSPKGSSEIIIIDDEEIETVKDVVSVPSLATAEPASQSPPKAPGPQFLSNDEFSAFLQSGYPTTEQWLAADKGLASGHDDLTVPETFSKEQQDALDVFLAGTPDPEESLDYLALLEV